MIDTENQEYIVDESGTRKKVILNYDYYLQMLELLEDLQDSKLISMTKNESEIPLDEYIRKRELV